MFRRQFGRTRPPTSTEICTDRDTAVVVRTESAVMRSATISSYRTTPAIPAIYPRQQDAQYHSTYLRSASSINIPLQEFAIYENHRLHHGTTMTGAHRLTPAS